MRKEGELIVPDQENKEKKNLNFFFFLEILGRESKFYG